MKNIICTSFLDTTTAHMQPEFPVASRSLNRFNGSLGFMLRGADRRFVNEQGMKGGSVGGRQGVG